MESQATVFQKSIKQTEKVFVISLKELGAEGFGFYEVFLQLEAGKSESLLVARKNEQPIAAVNDSDWVVSADVFDYDAWVAGFNQHYLVLNESASWFIGVFTYVINTPLQWNLTIIGESMG
jgi:hypothetical protein